MEADADRDAVEHALDPAEVEVVDVNRAIPVRVWVQGVPTLKEGVEYFVLEHFREVQRVAHGDVGKRNLLLLEPLGLRNRGEKIGDLAEHAHDLIGSRGTEVLDQVQRRGDSAARSGVERVVDFRRSR